MTKKFDDLLESILVEMMPADIEGLGGTRGAVELVKKGVPEGESKGHWAPLQKLSQEDRNKVLEEIFKKVFSERKNNSYAPLVDNPEDLHGAIKTAIQNVSATTSLKASAKWAATFLTDRIMTLLKNKVKYTTSGGEETLPKEMTQKEFKQALNKALGDTKGQSVWKKSHQEEVPAAKETPAPVADDTESEGEVVYMKAADLDSEDPDLRAAFKKLPEDKELSYEQAVKLVKTTINGKVKGRSLVDGLIAAGGLDQKVKEKEVGENDEIPDLELGDEDQPDFERHIRDIDRGFSGFTRKGFGGDLQD